MLQRFKAILVATGLLFGPIANLLLDSAPARAATSDYHAAWHSQSPYVTLKRGQSAQFEVRLRNTGRQTWRKGIVNLGTSRDQDRVPRFLREDIVAKNPSGWLSPNRVQMVQNEVRPGEYGNFRFWYSATHDVSYGTHREYFRPVADGITWMDDWGIYWDVTVTDENGQIPTTSTPVASPPSSAGITYEHVPIQTGRGTFTTDIINVDLASGQFRVVTDASSEWDCRENCPAVPLDAFVKNHGGVAGIHGSYFCPPDYSGCGGTNSFFWKIFHSGAGRMLNERNGLGELDPFLVFDENSRGHFLGKWTDHRSVPFRVSAGINHKPALVRGSQNVLDEGALDDKQRTVRSSRGAIGLRGQTLVMVIVHGATVPDAAAVMDALHVDDALNLDGGGSSAMYYNGSYKVGPGRRLPNAIVIVRK